MSELLPCPFCGGEPTLNVIHECEDGTGEVEFAYVYCSHCGTQRGERPSEFTARQAWNLRAVDNEPCEHKSVHDGPRVEARWGTVPTQVCDCGAWRTMHHKPGHWQTSPHSSTKCECGDSDCDLGPPHTPANRGGGA